LKGKKEFTIDIMWNYPATTIEADEQVLVNFEKKWTMPI